MLESLGPLRASSAHAAMFHCCHEVRADIHVVSAGGSTLNNVLNNAVTAAMAGTERAVPLPPVPTAAAQAPMPALPGTAALVLPGFPASAPGSALPQVRVLAHADVNYYHNYYVPLLQEASSVCR